jgi:hypothetical protein
MYFLVYDDRKVPADVRIRRACAYFEERYHKPAGVVLVHPSDLTSLPDVLVCTGESQGIPIRPNNFWVGPI